MGWGGDKPDLVEAHVRVGSGLHEGSGRWSGLRWLTICPQSDDKPLPTVNVSVTAQLACSKSSTGYRPLASVESPDGVAPPPPKALAICAAAGPDSVDCTARSAAAAMSPLPDEKDRRCLPGCGCRVEVLVLG